MGNTLLEKSLTRTCPCCKTEKESSEYTKDSRRPDKLSTYCRSCNREKARKYYNPQTKRSYYLANKEMIAAKRKQYYIDHPEKVRHHHLRTSYGLSPEKYEEMVCSQEQKCAICGNTSEGESLHVDHNHHTGKIRGLLCRSCNTKLVAIEDREFLQSALRYLDKYDE